MSNFVAELAAKHAKTEGPTIMSPPPDPRRPKRGDKPWWQAYADVIEPGEQLTDEECERRYSRVRGYSKPDGSLMINGATPITGNLLTAGVLQRHGARGLLEKVTPETKTRTVRSVYKPVPATREAAEVRSLRSTIRDLSEKVTGTTPALPTVTVQPGHCLVYNTKSFPIGLHHFGIRKDGPSAPRGFPPTEISIEVANTHEIFGGEVLEVTEETAEKMCRSGAIQRVRAEDVARWLAEQRA